MDECNGCKELRFELKQLRLKQDVIGDMLTPSGAGETLRELIIRKGTDAERNQRHLEDSFREALDTEKRNNQLKFTKITQLEVGLAALKSRGALIITLVSLGLGFLNVALRYL